MQLSACTNNDEEKSIPTQVSYESVALTVKAPEKKSGVLFAALGVIGLIAVIGFNKR